MRGPATPTKRVPGARAQGLDEARAQVVTRGLACDEADRERTRVLHQRMMLRSLAARKSTKGAISGCAGTSARSCSAASASFSFDR